MIDLANDLEPDEITDDILRERMRMMRDGLLASSDWTQTADDPTGKQAAWAEYRQQLRDAPDTWEPGPTWTPPPTP